jgi:hypothetical protein
MQANHLEQTKELRRNLREREKAAEEQNEVAKEMMKMMEGAKKEIRELKEEVRIRAAKSIDEWGQAEGRILTHQRKTRIQSQNGMKADDLETAMDQLMDEQNQREEAEEEVRRKDSRRGFI